MLGELGATVVICRRQLRCCRYRSTVAEVELLDTEIEAQHVCTFPGFSNALQCGKCNLGHTPTHTALICITELLFVDGGTPWTKNMILHSSLVGA